MSRVLFSSHSNKRKSVISIDTLYQEEKQQYRKTICKLSHKSNLCGSHQMKQQINFSDIQLQKQEINELFSIGEGDISPTKSKKSFTLNHIEQYSNQKEILRQMQLKKTLKQYNNSNIKTENSLRFLSQNSLNDQSKETFTYEINSQDSPIKQKQFQTQEKQQRELEIDSFTLSQEFSNITISNQFCYSSDPDYQIQEQLQYNEQRQNQFCDEQELDYICDEYCERYELNNVDGSYGSYQQYCGEWSD